MTRCRYAWLRRQFWANACTGEGAEAAATGRSDGSRVREAGGTALLGWEEGVGAIGIGVVEADRHVLIVAALASRAASGLA